MSSRRSWRCSLVSSETLGLWSAALRPAALKLVSTKRFVYQPAFDLHSGGILAIVGVRGGSSLSVRRRGNVREMVRDILLGFSRDVGVVKSSLEAGSTETHQKGARQLESREAYTLMGSLPSSL